MGVRRTSLETFGSSSLVTVTRWTEGIRTLRRHLSLDSQRDYGVYTFWGLDVPLTVYVLLLWYHDLREVAPSRKCCEIRRFGEGVRPPSTTIVGRSSCLVSSTLQVRLTGSQGVDLTSPDSQKLTLED